MKWEEIKERNRKTYKTKHRKQKTCRGIRRVLKLNNFIKHYMKSYMCMVFIVAFEISNVKFKVICCHLSCLGAYMYISEMAPEKDMVIVDH